MDEARIADIIEIGQLCARYAAAMTKDDIDEVISVFAPGGTYSAFGDVYELTDFPKLVAAAPKGLFMCGVPAIDFTGPDTADGTTTLHFVDQTNHHPRLGWYTDQYERVDGAWRLRTRKMTFLRKSGARDSGKAHDPTRPEGSGPA